VTIAAMETQAQIAEQIVAQSGDYLLAVKGNQKTLLEDLDDLFAGCDEVAKGWHIPRHFHPSFFCVCPAYFSF
jgi:predicted transposase YbfD/YdcC